jgi:Rad3-related DNA helicase
LERAKHSNLVSTNYSYWLHSRRSSPTALCYPDGPPVELLICDEAHSAMEELSRFLQVSVPISDLDTPPEPAASGLMSEPSGDGWKKWATARAKGINDELNRLKHLYSSVAEARQEEPRYTQLENLKKKLSAILSMDNNWTWEAAGEHVVFDAIWPGRYSSLLFSNVERILLLSATLRPYTLSLLGLPKDQYDFREFSNGWPPNRGLVYFLPTARMGFRSTDQDYQRIVDRIDEIIASRKDRKGIIHTVSYQRMRLLLARSKYARYMYHHEKASDAVDTARRFRAAAPPAVLISPSYATGWDFVYDQCEYQIIPKMPFAYSESRVMRERLKDKSYRYYTAILELVQMVGRGRRAADDRCETFILDSNFTMAQVFGKQFFPDGFKIYKQNTLPDPAEKLTSPLARQVPKGLS